MNTNRRPSSQQKENSLGARSLRSNNPADEKDLQAQMDKIKSILQNPGIKLPDGGKKLQARLDDLKQLLEPKTSTITQGVSDLSLADSKRRPNMRQQIIEQSNQVSDETGKMYSSLLKVNPNTATTASTAMNENDNTASSGRKTRMLGLEESVKLQESQEKDKKLAAMRKKMELVREATKNNRGTVNGSLADELSMTMSGLKLDPETRPLRPDDDDPDTEDEDDDDEEFYSEDDDEPLGDLERYDDEGFDEADDVIEQYDRRRFG